MEKLFLRRSGFTWKGWRAGETKNIHFLAGRKVEITIFSLLDARWDKKSGAQQSMEPNECRIYLMALVDWKPHGQHDRTKKCGFDSFSWRERFSGSDTQKFLSAIYAPAQNADERMFRT